VLRARIIRSDDHRVPPGRAHAHVQPETAQFGRDMIGGRTAILCVCRIGGDRSDTQEREEALYAAVETAINVFENRRQGIGSFHCFTVSGAARANACTAMLLLLRSFVMKFVRGAL
jgi:hypothetical protein